jgi:hypothetical protein
MAELHRFQDQAKTPEGRKKPISAQWLDENFVYCRAQVGKSLESLIKRTEDAPNNDKLEFAGPQSGTYFLYIRNGAFELIEIPSSGQFYVKFVDGAATTIGRTDCSTE